MDPTHRPANTTPSPKAAMYRLSPHQQSLFRSNELPNQVQVQIPFDLTSEINQQILPVPVQHVLEVPRQIQQGEQQKSQPISSGAVKSNRCPECGFLAKNEFGLSTHMGMIHNERKFSCTDCDLKFPSLASKDRHRKKHAEEKNVQSSAVLPHDV